MKLQKTNTIKRLKDEEKKKHVYDRHTYDTGTGTVFEFYNQCWLSIYDMHTALCIDNRHFSSTLFCVIKCCIIYDKRTSIRTQFLIYFFL